MAYNTNTTTSTASTTGFNQTFHDRVLLKYAMTKLVYASFGQKKPIPAHSGKTVEFRRYETADPTPANLLLTEGTTPDGQSLSQTTVSATVKQYGAYYAISDLLDLSGYDPVLKDAEKLLGEQMGRCADWIARDAMVSGASIQWAGGNTATYEIEKTDIMSLVEVKKAVRTLTKAKAIKYGNGADYVMIISPDQKYDLMSDDLWESIATHADPQRLFNNEVGRCFGVAFVESTEALVETQSVCNKVNATTTTSATFVLKNTPTAAETAYLVAGAKIMIGATVAAATEHTVSSFVAGTKTVTLSATASLTANDLVYSLDAGAPDATGAGADIHHALIFGAEAYGIVDIVGSSAIKAIIHPPTDPLELVWTVGAKITAYAVKVLNGEWIIDLQTGVSD